MLTNCAAKVIKNGKRKAENGKLFVLRFTLGVRKRTRRQAERRECLHFMPRREGGKAHAVGLKRKTENFLFLANG